MEETKQEQSHDVSIALIQKDIGYIREAITKIDTTLAVYDRNFARKDELKEIEKGIEKLHIDIKVELAKKVNHDDFDPIKKTLSRINWMVISAVVVGLLALVLKK